MRVVRVRALVAAGLLLAACTGVGGGGTPQGETRIDMKDNFFTRDVTRVPVGSPVTFRNQGRIDHNAIAVDGAFSTVEATGKDVLSTDDEITLTVDEPGVHLYYCSLHGTPEGEGMVATLVAGDAEYYPEAQAGEQEPVDTASGRVLTVPDDHDTIQAAVDDAEPGDLVLIGPGTYREQVNVTTPSIVLRGTDRNEVVIDSEFQRPNGINITADAVAVENLTVRNAVQNGVFWTGVTGYRASYVTAYNNAVYGIYAFDAVDGLFAHSYASGSADAGFYIGQCRPCDAVIDGVTAEYNALGYSGTNASGPLQIIRSMWRANVAGIAPNTLDTELLPPVRDVDVVGNTVTDHGRTDVPVLGIEWPTLGNGIILAGAENVRVQRNRITGSSAHGVLVVPNLSKNFWFSSGNVIRDNAIAGSGVADLGLAGPAGAGNCFAGNDGHSSVPPGLQTFSACGGGLRLPLRWDTSTLALSAGRVAEANTGQMPDNPVKDGPVPPPQPQMPDAADAPAQPAMHVFESARVDLDAIELPPPPADGALRSQEILMAGLPIAAVGGWSLLFGFYLYFLPGVLLAAWVALAFWDIARRTAADADLSRAAAIAWIAAILLIPFLGVIAYHAAGKSRIPGWLRLAMVAGGLLAYGLIAGVGALLGGVV